MVSITDLMRLRLFFTIYKPHKSMATGIAEGNYIHIGTILCVTS